MKGGIQLAAVRKRFQPPELRVIPEDDPRYQEIMKALAALERTGPRPESFSESKSE